MTFRSLLIWECGQNLGHISHLAAIAKVLHDLDFDIFLCVKEENNLASVFKDIPYQLIPFPKLAVKVSHHLTFSMSDILIRRGLADITTLNKQLKSGIHWK